MLIGQKVNDALNEQIGYEFSASLQYVAITAYFEGEGLVELADLFHQQSDEERDHAMRIVKYVIDAGGKLLIPAIPAPRAEFTDACDAIELSLKSEQKVTQQINSLVNLAISEGDHITQNMLTWFVAEQLEEVSSMDTLLSVAKRASDNLLYVEEYVARHKQSLLGKSSAE
ncbi:MAG: ferritin [Verrucomicrobiales bacterium]|jgi:bacterioferritin B|nr:ferritin [Verrucomicrobiales bacterium]MBT6450200.1 ferritin [Verrucomicrobiales bacterium]MDE2714989.1 ferritin [Verrucomicrobiota bacterium]|tara:strand:+ start:1731 stop:2243 length:513 start_codon:yes stop_codon:yes gene_type:complete